MLIYPSIHRDIFIPMPPLNFDNPKSSKIWYVAERSTTVDLLIKMYPDRWTLRLKGPQFLQKVQNFSKRVQNLKCPALEIWSKISLDLFAQPRGAFSLGPRGGGMPPPDSFQILFPFVTLMPVLYIPFTLEDAHWKLSLVHTAGSIRSKCRDKISEAAMITQTILHNARHCPEKDIVWNTGLHEQENGKETFFIRQFCEKCAGRIAGFRECV